jgi:competence protein ComEA
MQTPALSRRRTLIAALLVVGALAAAGRYLMHAGASTTPVRSQPVAQVTTAKPAKLVVHVVGAVRRPGLYRLPEGSRTADAVKRAGGATPRAELAVLNLAAPLADGIQVVVPRRAAPGAPTPQSTESGDGSSGATGAPVSLSTATLEQLDALPGVGPVTAQKIIDYRTEHGSFASVDELDAVPGIGPKRLEQLREALTP